MLVIMIITMIILEKIIIGRHDAQGLELRGKKTSIGFHLGSFFDIDDWVNEGDVVFMNSTCFSTNTVERLSTDYFFRMKSNSYIITLTHSLDETLTGFKLIGEERLAMSWGHADFFLHFKES